MLVPDAAADEYFDFNETRQVLGTWFQYTITLSLLTSLSLSLLKRVHVEATLYSPCLILPGSGRSLDSDSQLIVDLGRIQVSTELRPKDARLEVKYCKILWFCCRHYRLQQKTSLISTPVLTIVFGISVFSLRHLELLNATEFNYK